MRFADDVPAEEAAGIESALAAAGLLDAWVCADADRPAEFESELFLVPLPEHERPTGRTLADVLVVEDDSDALEVPRAEVAAVL
ncbi:hypothetical protein, partial [Nocardia farcinica]|uniref:hypothetical protein n=1 Tax=Nocardia farcinica TaxID=37329 RepID=UPI003F689C2D